MHFAINDKCVGCLACVRACPAEAILADGERVWIDDDTCVRTGACVPACPHDAIDVLGDVDLARDLVEAGDAVVILSGEAGVHFYPVTPEQVVNACFRLGFRVVHHGVLGDELVAAEYQRLMGDPGWGTMIRSTCPVVVEKIRREYPELVPNLAPVVTPLMAEAAYIRRLYGPSPIVYVGVCLADAHDVVDAALTLQDLEGLFEGAGIDVGQEPQHFNRIPPERRRHLSTAGGLPLEVLLKEHQASRRFRKFRGIGHLEAIRRAVAVDGIDLGFVDILPCEGCLDHPLLGPKEELYWRRRVTEQLEPPRSPLPVLDPAVKVDLGAVFEPVLNSHRAADAEIQAVIRQIGTAPNGQPWDCGACGYGTCRAFAQAVLDGRTTFRLCPPYQERRAKVAEREAAVDGLTGLATFRVLKDRVSHELARSRQRSGDPFAVVFVDMDGFKELNDRYGHEAGNRVLAAVGQLLQGAVRATDIAARYGGDEFVLVLIRTDSHGAMRVAELVRQRLEAAGRALGFPEGVVKASLGVAAFDPSHPLEEDILEAADRALYRAKAAGGNRVA